MFGKHIYLVCICFLVMIGSAMIVSRPEYITDNKYNDKNSQIHDSIVNLHIDDTVHEPSSLHAYIENAFVDVSRLRLSGTIVSEINRSAIISVDGDHESLYQLHDMLLDGFKIVDISRSYIIIQRRNNFVKINTRDSDTILDEEYSETSADENGLKFEDKLNSYINGRSLVSVAYPVGVKSVGVKQVTDHFYLLNRKVIEDQILNKNAFSHVNVEFSDKNEAIITEVVPGSVFDSAGLLPGDEIVSVDQSPVNSIFDFIDIYSQSEQLSEVGLMVKRRGEIVKLDYEYY